MKKFLSTFITLWVTWLLLAGFSANELIVGGIASLVLSAIISKYLDFSFDVKFFVMSFKFIFMYVPIFIVELIKANFDMAYRVLSPSMPLNPGFVKVP